VEALVGMGIPEYEAKRYEGRIKSGGVLLSVHCDTSDDIQRAKDILKRTGAEDIASTGEEAVGAAATTDRNKASSREARGLRAACLIRPRRSGAWRRASRINF
jgi:hypothetical protein